MINLLARDERYISNPMLVHRFRLVDRIRSKYIVSPVQRCTLATRFRCKREPKIQIFKNLNTKKLECLKIEMFYEIEKL